ncbi:hypothetical protein HZH66_006845 [Vespula vulgaris]|uniref:Uncharacterized protein n=1 Tax=Vespula vulgaris TaxID=7454 RepID=A0A834K297_VESVU|nr:hypothetical protein HZH66_006845 [Vespula vulgaris]
MNIYDELDEGSDLCGSDPSKIHIRKFYPMNGKNRGLAIIFSHTIFLGPYEPRIGNDVDCNRMESLLKELGFEVKIYKDRRKQQIFKILSEVSDMDHSDNDCLAIVVMSHGDPGILQSYDEPYKVHEFWSKFTKTNCPSLEGKPKLFFIQACRGDETDSGILLKSPNQTYFQYQSLPKCNTMTDVKLLRYTQEELEIFLTPGEPDFLIGYATTAGHCSFRRNKGSWYIEELYSIFQQYGRKYDLLTLLTFVAQQVAVKYVSFSPMKPEIDDKLQIPCIIHTLVKQLYFFPEEAEDVPVNLQLD